MLRTSGWASGSLLACAWLAAVLGAGPAEAQGSEPVVAITVDPCVPIDRAALHKLLAIELGTTAAPSAEQPGAPTHVWVSCSEQGIELRLEDGVTSKIMTRALPASSFRDASSTRLLALAIAEFVVASWTELGVTAEPSVPPVPVGPPPTPEAQRVARKAVEQYVPEPLASREPHREISISAGVLMQLWPTVDARWLGGGLRLWRSATDSVAWHLAFDFAATEVDVANGRVTGMAGSVALSGLLYIQPEPLVLSTGPGIRIGGTRLEGNSSDETFSQGRHFFAPFGGPFWLVRIEVRAGETLRIALDAELGITTLPARGTFADRDVFGVDGLWLTPMFQVGGGF